MRGTGRRRSHAARHRSTSRSSSRRTAPQDLLLSSNLCRRAADKRLGVRSTQSDMIKVRFAITQSYPHRVPRQRLRARLGEPLHGNDEQHRHADRYARHQVALRRQARVQPRHGRADQRHQREYDRPPLDERQYMRVDWSTNHAAPDDAPMQSPVLPPELQVKRVPNTGSSANPTIRTPSSG